MESAPIEFLGSLITLADEELALLAKGWEGQEAMDLLILRHGDGLKQRIASLARRQKLKPEDRKDAQQLGHFWLREAVRRFDATRVRRAQPSPFRAFLHRVVRNRFLDFARCLRYDRKHVALSLEAVEMLDDQGYQLPGLIGYGHTSSRVGEDPAAITEAKEERQRLAAAVEKLDEHQRRVYDAMATGATRRMIAQQFGVTYAVADTYLHDQLGLVQLVCLTRTIPWANA